MLSKLYRFLVWHVLSPYTLLLIVLVIGVAWLWRRRKESWRRLLLVTIPLVLLILVSMPCVSGLAVDTLENHYAPLPVRPADVDVIVVLGSYVYGADETRREHDLDEDGWRRCLLAAALYGDGPPCAVIVCGGRPGNSKKLPTCAEVMAEKLAKLGVPRDRIIEEAQSQTTHENAVEAAKMIRERGFLHVVLVTNAVDLYRAERCFLRQGVAVTPAGCQFQSGEFRWKAEAFVPTADAAASCSRVFHEWLGVFWYWLNDRI